MEWTDERVEMLRKYWAEGLSASRIAAQMGGVSRNAVIGKVHRLKLSSRGRTTTATTTRTKKAAPAQAPRATKPMASRPMTTMSVGATALQMQFDAEPVARRHYRPTEDVVVPISRRLALVDLSERTCKWPNGDPLSEDFSFCGNDSAETGPYCGFHSKVAFQPASERRRVR